MLPGEFELYGHRFRWSASERADGQSGQGPIPLIRTRQPLPTDSVEWLSRGDGRVPAYGKLGECSVYRFESVADFLFPPDGRFVRMSLHPDADHAAFEFTLYRGVLPRILHLRGTTCLHASAVALAGGVVAFCGPSGAGKSTLSAALVSRGLALVTDDVLPLRAGPCGNDLLAGPGLPELRLYPDTADWIGIGDQAAVPLPGETKVRWQPRRAPDAPQRLLGIYLLEPGLHGSSEKPASVSPLSRSKALIELISNSFWIHPCETSALAKDMLCLGQLLRSVAVSRLSFELTEAGLRAVEELVISTAKPATR